MAKEAETEHVRRRLYPEVPADMPYVCFYPMDKKREAGQNWYALPLEERSRLMMEHGMSGRRYAGRVSQVVTTCSGSSRPSNANCSSRRWPEPAARS